MDKFIDVLKYLRNNSGISQKQLSKELGISERNYQRYEYGEREPSLSTLIKLADYFNVSLDYLTGRTDEPVNPNVKNNNS